MTLEIQSRKIYGLGIVSIPLDRWQTAESNLIYKIDEMEEKFQKIGGLSYITSMCINQDGNSLDVEYEVRTNPGDNEFPPLYFYRSGKITLTGEQIDEAFKDGCSIGSKTQFRRKK